MATTLALFAGCGRVDEASIRTEHRLRVISAAYLDFAAARGKGPPNMEELKSHLASSMSAKLKLQELGLEDCPTLFVSERDALPFVLSFGEPVSVARGTSATPIVFEARGVGGTRYAAFANGKVECVEANTLVSQLGTMAVLERSRR